ncbi:MAG: branched-chain amino acid ABC transporter permease [SAR324 cluster bacterium]|nr:branched-chain amino acid ABC transporter permease [SAR324 cluster bacterium]
MNRNPQKVLGLHLAILLVLFLLQFVLPAYHHTTVARIMVLASFAVGYNILLGYTGLMSLGHAMFFSAGMYGAGLGIYHLGLSGLQGFGAGLLSAAVLSLVFGLIALRTTGVSFLIVTLMFGQAVFLSLLYFNEITLGQDGFSLSQSLKPLNLGGAEVPFSDPDVKYNLAWLLFAVCFLLSAALVLSPAGRVLIAIRENEERTKLLGYNTYLYKLFSLVASGTIAGAAGAVHALLFSYVGTTFAEIHHSISPLLWTLLGGMGTTLGPLLGTGIMHYLIDITSGLTSGYLFVVGGALLLLVLWFPQGLMGAVRNKWASWLP